MEEAAGLIVMGGPMGVYESRRYPFLSDEMRFIEQALHSEKPVLGICLGSQLLAATLSAQVRPAKQKEIGWYPVMLTPLAREDLLWKDADHSFTAFHWHGDMFQLPRGTVHLASSGLTDNQAFRYGSCAYGLLFHLEVTEQMIRQMVKVFSDELREAKVDGTEIVRLINAHVPGLRRIGKLVFQRWVGLAGQQRGERTLEEADGGAAPR